MPTEKKYKLKVFEAISSLVVIGFVGVFDLLQHFSSRPFDDGQLELLADVPLEHQALFSKLWQAKDEEDLARAMNDCRKAHLPSELYKEFVPGTWAYGRH